ncbi:MAG TPA: twin-arginine translocase subunit TatC [Clostridia bacterium]|jgi:sec-independent protein translocase protein TatC|nr:twin-arginine translocase subunit TatC [Clostridia bacterium]HHY06050.1 twin-arginine translocase subunit TatC [Clostridia bacterium]
MDQIGSGSLYEHLEELRKVLLNSLLALIICSILSYVLFLPYLMQIFLTPINNLGIDLIFIGVTESFITQLKLAIFGGIILSSPFVLWQIIAFVSPALYKNEKKAFFFLLMTSVILFTGGIVFAYLCVLQLGLKILLITLAANLTPMISFSFYISFIFKFLIPFGLVFEIPVITYFLTKVRLITPELLITKRKYFIFGIFVLAAILTPPDIISQIMLAIPMLILYEISIFISKGVSKAQKKKLAEITE